jgi:acyl carrier protein
MSLVRLISFLEENYDIQVQDEDIVPENFSSLAKISSFVAARRKRP